METNQFFLIILPGLEDLAHRELMEKCPPEAACVIKGGIEVTANLEWISEAHLRLKIPTRILLRLSEFKVRDFPKLHQKFLNLNWNKFLSHPSPSWEISCTKSRLNHTGRIEDTITSALGEALKKQPLSRDWEKHQYPAQTFYVRLVDDNLVLSLDLTGEPLYKRNLQSLKGEAPLRENIAAALVYELTQGISDEVTLLDPMCGSGTFLTEALTFKTPLHLRSFAFESAPFFKGKTLKKTKEIIPVGLVQKAVGYDINQELLKKVSAELENFPIEFRNSDSLKTSLKAQETVMICNPPYGERLKLEGQRGAFLKAAWKKFIEVDRPLRFGWLLPKDMDDLFLNPQGYREVSRRSFRNGGLPVTFWIWQRL